jgi:hypothetical protein
VRQSRRRRLGLKIVEWLTRHNFLTTPEEDEYYAWADTRLDQLEVERRIAQRAKKGNNDET